MDGTTGGNTSLRTSYSSDGSWTDPSFSAVSPSNGVPSPTSAFIDGFRLLLFGVKRVSYAVIARVLRSPGRKHLHCWLQISPLADVLFQPVTETSSVLAANGSVAEALYQPGFVGTRVGGFHDTSLQSNMKCDINICKELYAMSRCHVARPQ